jgi:hypothetical protein
MHSMAVEVESNCDMFEFFKSYKEKSINNTIKISKTCFASLGKIVRKNKVKKMVSNMVKTLVGNDTDSKFDVRKSFKNRAYETEKSK